MLKHITAMLLVILLIIDYKLLTLRFTCFCSTVSSFNLSGKTIINAPALLLMD